MSSLASAGAWPHVCEVRRNFQLGIQKFVRASVFKFWNIGNIKNLQYEDLMKSSCFILKWKDFIYIFCNFWLPSKLNSILRKELCKHLKILYRFFSAVPSSLPNIYHLFKKGKYLRKTRLLESSVWLFCNKTPEINLDWVATIFLPIERTYFALQKLVCTLGVAPSLVSRWREGYSFRSSWGP